ncbi:MAG: hypothetical protein KKC05_02690 [Nanoarchaeota archaeon]|nr:hypothetical protein [Nanoarchaeota archaeon]
MNGKKITTSLIILSFLFLVTIPGVFAVPVDWWGTVLIDTNASTDGAVVSAHINNSNTSAYMVTDIVGTPDSGYYLIHVPCSVGDTVNFRVYNVSVNQSAQACKPQGSSTELDLTMNKTGDGTPCSYSEGCSTGYCVHGTCRTAATYCGDGFCDTGESCTADCGAGTSNQTSSGSISSGSSDDVEEATEEYKIKPGKTLESDNKLQNAIKKALDRSALKKDEISSMIDISSLITKDFTTSRNIKTTSSKSTLTTTIKYSGSKRVKNLIVYETVPKTVASSSDDITVTAPGAIIGVVEKDPQYIFVFAEVNPSDELVITYEVSDDVSTGVLDDFSTEVYGESLENIPVECGNGVCDAGESSITCPVDCPRLSPRCTPGEHRCVGSVLQQCNLDQLWVTETSCENGCSNGVCREPQPILTAPPATIMALFILIAIVAGIMGMLYYKKRNY